MPPEPVQTLPAESIEERLRQLEALNELLPTLAGALDLRNVFERVADIAQRAIPHDAMGVILLDKERQHVIPYAVRGIDPALLPTRLPLTDPSYLLQLWEYRIIDDMQVLPQEHHLPPARQGLRAALRVPVYVFGELAGGVAFMSYTAGRYSVPDALIARRIADHVALALSHQRLAEEAARAAEARERAARLELRVRSLTHELTTLSARHRVVGESEGWQSVLRQAAQVAETDTTVLLQGESGTGKEVVARFIHRGSARKDAPFVAVNCAALPDQLLESELFGYERGAFTGATHTKPGQLELAAGGTVLLDEIAEMSGAAQAKLLRVLETREFQHLGGTRALRTDVRFIAATNRQLRAAVERGTFREDLFYRLHVFAIDLPPLRERKDDILPLSEAFLEELGQTFGRPPAGISLEARDALVAHDWPGNVRELRNALERAAIVCNGGLITAAHLGLIRPVADASETTARPAEPTDLWSVERSLVKKALDDARHNKSRAARILGLTRTQLYVRLRRYGLD